MSDSRSHLSATDLQASVRTAARIRARLRHGAGVLACCAAVAGLGLTAGVASAKTPVPAAVRRTPGPSASGGQTRPRPPRTRPMMNTTKAMMARMMRMVHSMANLRPVMGDPSGTRSAETNHGG